TPLDEILVNAGTDVVRIFDEALSDDSIELRQQGAALSLALLGGEEAKDILKRHAATKDFHSLKSSLCYCMATTGSKEDITFLIQTLSGDHTSQHWVTTQAAALSLGALGARESVDELKNCASKNSGTFTSNAAQLALGWIEKAGKRRSETPPPPELTEADKIRLCLFEFGIPRTNESKAFVEKRRNRVWRQTEKGWREEEISSGEPEDDLPAIDIDFVVSRDGARAIASVSLVFGRLNAIGYKFTLKRIHGGWSVRSILFTWVS
ncbi:MAG: HEAT repeat domain-containing protein, partial [Planctomycetota bacterium]